MLPGLAGILNSLIVEIPVNQSHLKDDKGTKAHHSYGFVQRRFKISMNEIVWNDGENYLFEMILDMITLNNTYLKIS